MERTYVYKGVIGAAGMSIGAALVTLIGIAAVDGVETARVRHLADVASGRAPAVRVVARGELDCPNLAGAEAVGID